MSIVKVNHPFVYAAGDKKAFTTVFDHYYPALCFFANRILLDAEEAEDIAAETLLKLWKIGKSFPHKNALKKWLYLTTRNACLNHIKVTERTKHALTNMDTETQSDFILNEIVRAEVLREVRQGIDGLPAECRKIFILHYFGQLTRQEIALKLRISTHTVKNQLVRGIDILRSRMKVELVAFFILFKKLL